MAAIAALLLELPPIAMGGACAVWMFLGPTWDATVVGHRIRIAPDALQGRIESVSSLVSFGAAALGPLVAGVVAGRAGVQTALVVLGAVMLGTALAGALVRFPSRLVAPGRSDVTMTP